jgi:hypothetical protein
VPITEPHTLANKDVVRVCDMQVRFIETRKDPGSLGLQVVYASQMKGFSGGPSPNADPSATTLGLGDPVGGPFNIGAVNDFQPPEAQQPRDLDLEIGDFGSPIPGDTSASGDSLSIHLELDGLSPDLRRSIEALFGKVIELPALRLRIKSDDGR